MDSATLPRDFKMSADGSTSTPQKKRNPVKSLITKMTPKVRNVSYLASTLIVTVGAVQVPKVVS